jgi:hypothetical protein
MGEPAGDEAEGLSDGTSVVRRKSTDDECHDTSDPAIVLASQPILFFGAD